MMRISKDFKRNIMLRKFHNPGFLHFFKLTKYRILKKALKHQSGRIIHFLHISITSGVARVMKRRGTKRTPKARDSYGGLAFSGGFIDNLKSTDR